MRMPLRTLTRPTEPPPAAAASETRADGAPAVNGRAPAKSLAEALPAAGEEGLPTGSNAPRAASLTVEQAIGAQIRQHRKTLDITSAELAATARISPGMISKIENGQISSSLATLTALASALNVPIASLFAGYDDRRDCSFVKAGQGALIERRGTKAGHIYELLGHSLGAGVMIEPFLITLTDEAAPYSAFRHAGVELIYMLGGCVGYRHGDRIYQMEPGDTLFFDASAQHGPEELISVPATYLSIIVYPKE
ncbi:helix-turn-helix domain-containing protein [Ancylobacter amanitiformis]|uniref:Transcriptional regulator with XRE-family HTH domain n=1 Tax=Ancylobacter amanitiformis TaxID=217069 RepID=A0ABU0LMF7_9HYPH|nr:XRE family transcriptional regulator [Ancylobacter amanitiformis]MDQ0509886.1 transcriptional regulator with XRE-family HTH domain [Ancylobacter amanitiformis]